MSFPARQAAAKGIAKSLVPPLLWQGLRRLLGAGGTPRELLSGTYSTWEDALRASSGYDAPLILEKARRATREVLEGKAAFERDTVTFAQPEHDYAKLSGLLLAAAANGGKLSVMDVGGALGSSYHQNRPYLAELSKLRWSVLEQQHYVQCGRQEFETDVLRFYADLQELLAHERPDIILLSGVLQYLQRPYEFLRTLAEAGARFILVDRTPMGGDACTRLTVQRVVPSIYDASYPCWILDGKEIAAALSPAYRQLDEFKSGVDGDVACSWGRVEFRGMFFRLLKY